MTGETPKPIDKSVLRDAATIIVMRDAANNPRVLMGQRGHQAAFMPGKFVFPGGAVDPNDALAPLAPLKDQTARDLGSESSVLPHTLAAAAVRELWEETGQILGLPQHWAEPPAGWRGFAARGFIPNGTALRFFFRAVTPKGNPRRFDARFFLVNADDLATDPDDFSRAEDELSHLQWVPLSQARQFNLPFITQVVLAELVADLRRDGPPPPVPFFRNDDEAHLISRLGGKSPL